MRVAFDYAVVRVVPRVDREEFVNAGVIVQCRAKGWLGARVAFDEARILALDPAADLPLIRGHLDGIVKIAEGAEDGGPVARLPATDRFHWLVAPRSTIIQTSPVHVGLCDTPEGALSSVFEKMVRKKS